MTSERISLQVDGQPSSWPAGLLCGTALRIALIATILGCTATAIAGDHEKPASGGSQATISPAARLKQWFETGQASWYGLKFQGHKTSSGEKFDMNTFTCAHRSLPLGSWLRVTNLRNSKSVLVRVNDRGPMAPSRVVDLSYAAARAVGLGGTGSVKLERVNASDPEVARVFLAQAAIAPLPQLLPAR